MDLRPLEGYIIFESFRPDPGRIVLPKTAKKSQGIYYGKVLAVSDGWTGVMGTRYEHKLSVGDVILPPPSVMTVKHDGKEYCFCKETEVWCFIPSMREEVVFSVGEE